MVKSLEKEMLDGSFSISVERTIRPTYPKLVKELLHPEFETAGPAQFRVNELSLWVHDKQTNGYINGSVIYEHLKNNSMLEGCLNLDDLHEIGTNGQFSYLKYSSSDSVEAPAFVGWKSIAKDKDDKLRVPALVLLAGAVHSIWLDVNDSFTFNRPALRFP